MKIKRFYRTKMTMPNHPYEEDYLEVKNFPNRDLRFSYWYATNDFDRLMKIREESSYEVYVELCVVEKNEEQEKEGFLKSHNHEETSSLNREMMLQDLEAYLVVREARKGYLRYSNSVKDCFSFSFKKREVAIGVNFILSQKEIKAHKFRSFGEALQEVLYDHDREWNISRYHQFQHGQELALETHFIDRSGYVQKKYLLQQNDERHPLPIGLENEISLQFHLEDLAKSAEVGKITFGVKKPLWDESVNFSSAVWKNYEENFKPIDISDSIRYYYMVVKGDDIQNPLHKRKLLHHDLVQSRLAAVEFYENILDEPSTEENSAGSISLVMVRKYNTVLYIRTTSKALKDQLHQGRKEELRILNSLGYDPTEFN